MKKNLHIRNKFIFLCLLHNELFCLEVNGSFFNQKIPVFFIFYKVLYYLKILTNTYYADEKRLFYQEHHIIIFW